MHPRAMIAHTFAAALLVAALCCAHPAAAQSCDPNAQRVDCGYVGIDQQQCQDNGCCWMPVDPNPGNEPWCVYPNQHVQGYRLASYSKSATGGRGQLALIDGGQPQLGADISPLSLAVDFLSDAALRVRITDASAARWTVPEWIVAPPPAVAPASPAYAFSYTEQPFGFAVSRASDGSVLFNSTSPSDESFNGLQFKDQYLAMSTQLPPSSSLYGLGESTQSNGLRLQRNGNVYTLWARDTPCSVTEQNLYGSHPMYMQVAEDGSAHGVLLLNSNGMDVTLYNDSLLYQVVGGELDFYFFAGPTPDAVVQQYAALVGLPHMEPFWALGFHQSAYGMPDIQYVEEVVANYSAAAIPLDTIWSDIDYMDAYKDFTFDPERYPLAEVASFCAKLHANGQQYVPIVDPGIKVEQGYSSYTALLMSDAFIADSSRNPFQGQVWPGYTIFPDFLNPAAHQYWADEVAAFLDDVPFDGLWIDMNEISNFCNGECLNGAPIPLGSTSCGCNQAAERDVLLANRASAAKRDSGFNPTNPPYAINNGGSRDPLNVKTLDMDATHYNNTLEYNAHNLYGVTEAIATRAALESYYRNRRSFVLSRSTFPGSGVHAAHWTGDNQSVWPDMFYSIVGMLNFNMFAIPMIGADICGFNGDTTEEMCTRWIEVGAFSPFCRDHNAIGQLPQELYRFESTAEVGRAVLSLRYSLLPLFYTRMYRANSTGAPVLRPLFFQFASDAATHGIDKQFLVGDVLMVSPVLDQGATSVSAYFPAGTTFYSLYSFEATSSSSGSYKTLSAPLEFIPVHIIGGSVLVQFTEPGLTSAAARASSMNITVALNSAQSSPSAAGELFIDDGESYAYLSGKYTLMNFTATANTFNGTSVHSGFSGSSSVSTSFTSVAVLGVAKEPSKVHVNSASTSSFKYDKSAGVLRISSLSLDANKSFGIDWS